MSEYMVETQDGGWYRFSADKVEWSDGWLWLSNGDQVVALFSRETVIGAWNADAVVEEKPEEDGA